MELQLTVDRPNNEITFGLIGDLDLATAGILGEAIDVFDARHFTRVTIDVSEISFCDCAGLGALITAHHTITDTGGHLRLIRPSRPVQRLLTVARCRWLLTPAPSAVSWT
jgi:anti-anti-sigma factor